MIGIEYVKNFIRVDDDADDAVINALIDVSADFVKDAVGENADLEDKRVQLLQCMFIADAYDNRTQYQKGGYSLAMASLMMQLRLEMEIKADEEASGI